MREWRELDRRIAAFDNEFAALARSDADARRLATIPGIGVLNATALVAAIGNGQTFARGRDLAAWLGLVPRQVTTGGKPRLVGITKRGNKYLRKLLIHGARAALPTLATSATPLGGWLRGLMSACTRTPPWSRWPTSWRGSCGSCCGEARRSTPRPQGGGVIEIGRARHERRSATDVCWWWKRDGLTVDRRPGNLV